MELQLQVFITQACTSHYASYIYSFLQFAGCIWDKMFQSMIQCTIKPHFILVSKVLGLLPQLKQRDSKFSKKKEKRMRRSPRNVLKQLIGVYANNTNVYANKNG